MNPLLGVIYHWLGGLASGSFYVPFRGVKRWSWETSWLVSGVFSWLMAPWVFAWLNTTDVLTVLKETPPKVCFYSYIFGAAWGLGGLTFGLAMRYLGMSLGMAVALGYCTVFGTLIPPIYKGEFVAKLWDATNGRWILAGLGVCVIGIIVTALAGHSKEREMTEEQKRETVKEFSFKKGIIVATFSGIMSAFFAFGLNAGDSIRETTLKIDMVNSAAAAGKHAVRTTEPGGDDSKELSDSMTSLKSFGADKPASLAELIGVIEEPRTLQARINELKAKTSQNPEDARLKASLNSRLIEAKLKSKETLHSLNSSSSRLAPRIVAYAGNLSSTGADPKIFSIVDSLPTLSLKETALNVSAAGADLPEIHAKHSLWTGLPVLIVVLLGGFTTNFIWCVLLNLKNKTAYQYFSAAPGRQSPQPDAAIASSEGNPVHAIACDGREDPTPVPLIRNYFFAAFAGVIWYFQFFFYSMGETQMGEYQFSSWTLHMASIIIFSSIWGLALKEWKGASLKSKGLLYAGLAVLVLSTVIVGYGNYVGAESTH